MNKREYINAAMACAINEDRIKQIEELYNAVLDYNVSKVISYADTVDFFDEERRALSFDEIINAKSEIDADVVSNGILPLIDAYDCTYVVYLVRDKKWARFSSVDATVYMIKDELEDVL